MVNNAETDRMFWEDALAWARGRAVLATEWFEGLEAPTKELVVFDGSGHRPSFEQPDEFVRVMRDVVATTTRGGGP